MRIAFNYKLYHTDQNCRDFLQMNAIQLEGYRLSSTNQIKSVVAVFGREDDYVIFLTDYLEPFRNAIENDFERTAEELVVWDPLLRSKTSDHFQIELS